MIHRLEVYWPYDEANWQVHEDELFYFFHSATQITHLDVGPLPRMSLLLLSLTFASVCLPALKSLKLFATPLNLAAKFRFRRRYDRLESLLIPIEDSVDTGESTLLLQEGEPDRLELPRDGVKSLSLELASDAIELSQLVASFNIVEECRIVTHCACDFALILQQLSPSHLHTLALYSDSDLSIHPAPWDSAILPFHLLQSLSLSSPVSTSALFPRLQHLPNLLSLTIDDNIYLAWTDLEPILTGPTKVHSLKEITLWKNLVSDARRGPSYLDDGHEFYLWPGDDFFCPPDWFLEEWYSTFPREDIESFLDLAEEEGIEVGSHIRETLDFEDDYDAEWAQARIYAKTAEGIARIEEGYAVSSRIRSLV